MYTYSRLESEKEFTIETVTTESEQQAAIDGKENAINILAKLNRSEFESVAEQSVFDQPNFVLFHQGIMRRLLPYNKISLKILRFKDEPVAALYSYKDNGTLHVYQSGFNAENDQRYSLLNIMLSQEISSSTEDENITRFNFMYSPEEDTYKKDFSGSSEKMYNIAYDKVCMKSAIYFFIHIRFKNLIKKILKLI